MKHPTDLENKLGFDLFREKLIACCKSHGAAKRAERLSFSTDLKVIRHALQLTHETKVFLESSKEIPQKGYENPTNELNTLRIEGTTLSWDLFLRIRRALHTVRQLQNQWKKVEQRESYKALNALLGKLVFLPILQDEQNRIADEKDAIRNSASPALQNIRRSLQQQRQTLQRKINSLMITYRKRGILDENSVVAMRDDRPVIPVPLGKQGDVEGIIHDRSKGGKTLFIEPLAALEISNKIQRLLHDEAKEIEKILREFTHFLRPYLPDLIQNAELLEEFDFVQAKAQMAIETHAALPTVVEIPIVEIQQGVNIPLFYTLKKQQKTPVRLTLSINEAQQRLVLISGPNAGGKTVVLKTVGLLQYMLQCGLLVPCLETSVFGLFDKILIDLGDGQSIENDMSTYSSHLTKMKQLLQEATEQSMILIDELGSGTEPALGGAIAEALLEELNQRKVKGVITTHYTDLKLFASKTEGIVNAAMLYDTHKLEPLFTLNIGTPGSSFAFEIAHKIGLPQKVLDRASERLGNNRRSYDTHLREIIRDKKYWEKKRRAIKKQEQQVADQIAKYEKLLANAKQEGQNIIREAVQKSEQLLADSNRIVEQTIQHIKKTQAEKEATKQARQKVKQQRQRLQEVTKNIPSPKNTPQTLEPSASDSHSSTIAVGDRVKVEGYEGEGTVHRLKEAFAELFMGEMRMRVPLNKLKHIGKALPPKPHPVGYDTMAPKRYLAEQRLKFHPVLNIREMRVAEAEEKFVAYLDKAIMLGMDKVRILHGKGTGSLRNMVRTRLKTETAIRNFYDELPEQGGSGITVIEIG